MDLSGLTWRKSSFSGDGINGDCVEIAYLPQTIVIRDSKNPAAGTVGVPTGPWQHFLATVKGQTS